MADEKYRVLLVEDDPDWTDIISSTLLTLFAVTTADSIGEAESIIKQGRSFDAAVIDLGIGGSSRIWSLDSGYELATSLRADCGIPVIVLISMLVTHASQNMAADLQAPIIDKSQLLEDEEIVPRTVWDRLMSTDNSK